MEPTFKVIVQYKANATASEKSRSGGTKLADLDPINGELRQMTVGAAKAAGATAPVSNISAEHAVKSTARITCFKSPCYDYLPQTLHPQSVVKAGTPNDDDGHEIGIAVIDSGINENADLRHGSDRRVVYQESFVPGEGVYDYFGHGTHVAGIIAGDGSNSGGGAYLFNIHGNASGANLISLKVLDRNGAGTDSQVIAAINRAIQLKNAYKIKIINLSLGRGVYESFRTDPLCQAVERAWRAGIAVVVAAGNGGRDNVAGTFGYGTIGSPANDPLAITGNVR